MGLAGTEAVSLPYRTEWREMARLLDYSKGRGAERDALEARFGAGEALRETLNALDQLRLISRDDAGDIRLTELGERLAYAPDPARQREEMRVALAGYPPYRAALQRAFDEGLTVIEAPWVERVWQVDLRLGQPRNRVEEARTLFFRLLDEAGLGVYRRGVRGQVTRLDLAANAATLLAPLLDESTVRPESEPSRPAPAPEAGRAGVGAVVQPASQPPAQTAGVGPAGLSVQVRIDASDWELDKIAELLALLGWRSATSE
jgi:hypothetical protein